MPMAAGVSPCNAVSAAVAPKRNPLVVVMGSLRGGAATWHSMFRHLLTPLQADLALLTSAADIAQHAGSALLARAKYVWSAVEYEDWGLQIDELLGGPGWRNNVTLLPGLWGGVRVRWCRAWCFEGTRILRGSGAIMLSLRLHLLRHLDVLPPSSYSAVVLTRSDYLYLCPHPRITTPATRTLHVPAGEDHMGINDRHAIFAFADRHAVLGALPWLGAGGCRGCINLESALHAYFQSPLPADRLKVCRYKPSMLTVVAQRNSSSRWMVASHPVPESLSYGAQLWCKYESEFALASKSCNLGPQQRRCLPPDALEWLTFRNFTGTWDAYAGVGDAPFNVVVTGAPSRQLAGYGRFEWLVSSGLLPTAALASAARSLSPKTVWSPAHLGVSADALVGHYERLEEAYRVMTDENSSECKSDTRTLSRGAIDAIRTRCHSLAYARKMLKHSRLGTGWTLLPPDWKNAAPRCAHNASAECYRHSNGTHPDPPPRPRRRTPRRLHRPAP